MDLLSPVHVLVLLVVVLLVFGPKRLPEIGAGLGKTIREFRRSMSGLVEDVTMGPTVGPEHADHTPPHQDTVVDASPSEPPKTGA